MLNTRSLSRLEPHLHHFGSQEESQTTLKIVELNLVDSSLQVLNWRQRGLKYGKKAISKSFSKHKPSEEHGSLIDDYTMAVWGVDSCLWLNRSDSHCLYLNKSTLVSMFFPLHKFFYLWRHERVWCWGVRHGNMRLFGLLEMSHSRNQRLHHGIRWNDILHLEGIPRTEILPTRRNNPFIRVVWQELKI